MIQSTEKTFLAAGGVAALTLAAATARAGSPAPHVMLNITRPPVTQTYDAPEDVGHHRLTGRVTVRFCVDPEGKTEQLKVAKSRPPGEFDDTALALMRTAMFKPHRVNGQAVFACGIRQTIIFKPASRH